MEETINTRPQAIEIEKKLLSCLLQRPDRCIDLASEKNLLPNHFYLISHSKLYEVIQTLHNQEEKKEKLTDLSLLNQHFQDIKALDDIGGLVNLAKIWNLASNTDPILDYIQVVQEKFILRSIQDTCHKAGSQIQEQPEDVNKILDSFEKDILKIREGITNEDYNSVENIANQFLGKEDGMVQFLHDEEGIDSGFSDLDKLTGGFRAGEVFIIAARPGMGKTSFVLNIMSNISLKQKKSAMIFSLEMTTIQLIRKLVFAEARFDESTLHRGFVPSKEEVKKLKKSMAKIGSTKLWIDETSNISIEELRAKARRMKKEQKIEIIAVDYLQLMRVETTQSNREREVALVSAGLKALAKELKIPIIALSQLNRNPDQTKDGKPRLSDLRESGSIEQDADRVSLLHRPAYYEQEDESKPGIATLSLAKNRHGATGVIELKFFAKYTRFEAPSLRTEEE